MSMASPEVEVQLLKNIRDAIGQINDQLDSANRRVDGVESTILHRLDSVESSVTQRLGAIEVRLRELVEEQRSLVTYLADRYLAG